MRFQKFNILLIGSATALLTACDIYDSVPLFERIEMTPIELSVGGSDGEVPFARAVITDGTNKTLLPFDVDAKIFMVMQSEYDENHVDYDGAHDTKYNVARGDVSVSENDNTNNRSIVKFDGKNQRYWDDAHARSSLLSIWAYAQKGQNWYSCKYGSNTYNTATDPTQPYAWTTTEIVPTILTWRATHLDGKEDQNGQSLLAQDLLFTNNLANHGTSEDNRLKFNFETRKFPKAGDANMIFYHAMSKITIKLIEGEGFDKSSANDFAFTANTNVRLKSFNHTGTFDIKQGEFTSIADNGTTEIPTISLKSTTPNGSEYYTLEALAVPSIANNGKSRFVANAKSLTTDVMMEFTIDGNKYQITSGMLYDALHVDGNPANALVTNAVEKTDNGTYIPLEAGKNYIFTFNVGKTKIKNITAQVAEWENVEATQLIPTNARINLNLEERGGNLSDDDVVDIYRAARDAGSIKDDFTDYVWTTGYSGNKNTFRKNGDAWGLSNNWFWPDNKTYYHFRALMPTNQTVTTDGSNGDYVSLTSGLIDTNNDVIWGAPMLDVAQNETHDSFKWIYNTDTGFDVINPSLESGNHQIYHAIGPTEDAIKLVLFHMMSQVKFTITTNDGDNAAVILGDGSTDANKTKVELVDYYNKGLLRLGNGKVEITDSRTTNELGKIWKVTSGDLKDFCKYAVIPQDLSGVKLRITTPDHNQYIVDLASITVTTQPVTNNLANPYTASDGKYKINRWYPGFRYEYTLNLTKKGVTDVTATIVNWETVTAGNDNVQIR